MRSVGLWRHLSSIKGVGVWKSGEVHLHASHPGGRGVAVLVAVVAGGQVRAGVIVVMVVAVHKMMNLGIMRDELGTLFANDVSHATSTGRRTVEV